MKTKLLLTSLFLTGCIATNPEQWRRPIIPQDSISIEEDIGQCRELAWNESKYKYIYIGPITGSITRKVEYEDCMKKKGWIK